MAMGDDILVVKRSDLFSNGTFLGFLPSSICDYYDEIIAKSIYQVRSNELENDSSHKQVIPYVWIINSNRKKVFLYKRAASGNESRIHGKYSGGVGGHIDKKELVDGEGDPIFQAMMRELKEEVLMDNYPVPEVVGYINDDSEPVGKVHFGVVAIADTFEDVKPAEDMAEGRFYYIEEVEELFSRTDTNIEGWTKISWPFVKEYLMN